MNLKCIRGYAIAAAFVAVSGCASTSEQVAAPVARAIADQPAVDIAPADFSVGPIYRAASGRQCRRNLSREGLVLMQATCLDSSGEWVRGPLLESAEPRQRQATSVRAEADTVDSGGLQVLQLDRSRN